MLSSEDIGGLMAMMPAFATDAAAGVRSTSTIDVQRLHTGLDRMIRDGADVIATTGSFGECHTLLFDEFVTLANETCSATNGRVPLFIGVTSTNTREVFQKIDAISGAKFDGVLVGVPYYFPSSLRNAMRFYEEIADAFPHINIMIYHNPALHHVTLPVEAVCKLTKLPQVVGMKDSHRKPDEFALLCEKTQKKLSVFVFQGQYADYAKIGAAGFWSIDAWMGPCPQLALRDAVLNGDFDLAASITADAFPPLPPVADLSWRETASKIAVRKAGYVDPGPLRPPFMEVPDEVMQRVAAKVENWRRLCNKYKVKTTA